MTKDNEYQQAFSERDFWDKLKNFAMGAGKEVVEKALLLFYAMQEEKAPKWAKATIAGALGYFIMPFDAIIDLTPAVGYADDLGVLALAIAAVSVYINDNVRSKAAVKLTSWFGDDVAIEVDTKKP